MEDIKGPKPESTPSGPEHQIRMAVSALTLAASTLALVAQVVEHFRKPKAGKNERTKLGTAMVGLAVLRTMPALIKSARTLSADLKRAK